MGITAGGDKTRAEAAKTKGENLNEILEARM